ncbi:SusE domain-containing protein [Niabella sp. CC-SYL272]|uniref:SusE domain-containing protein n=1 Tax=Niabella agricola TaxID=2891571 RepID=UPI001F3A9D85|nr:SusE domain-containing protein [Niabella agricola]MCF3110173.1 SusE domain-containing protein [Niabella agricola]
MKYLFLYVFTALIALAFHSCKKDETQVVMNNNKPTLSGNSSGPITLLQENADKPALTLTYDNVDLGFADALGYTLQIAPVGNDFKADSLVERDLDRKAGSVTLTAKELNSLLLTEFIPAGQTINYAFRIRTSAGKIYSNVLPLTITTYEDWPRVIARDFLYTPGAYQGWDPAAKVIAKMYVMSGNKTTGQLEGSVFLPDPVNEFKLTPDPKWDNSYGSITNTGNKGTLDYNKGGNFSVTGKGYYKMKLDLTAKTWTATLNNISIIGNAAVDWNTDVPLDFDPSTQTFSKVLTLKSGTDIGFKFRANADWAVNFPGSNLTVPSTGTYKILLDMRIPSDPYWKIIKQ